MSNTLTALDAIFLELEEHSEGALMHTGGVMVFDPLPDGGAPTVEDLCALVTGRLGGRQRLSSERTGAWAWPHWTEDQRFEISNHISRAALPAPGSDTQLCDWIADFYSHKLDRTRPLWEMVLLEGLEEGRWALAQKTHHCLADGVGAVGVSGLPVDEPLALVRHRRIVASTLALKSSGAEDAAKTIVDLAALTPPLIHAAIARLLYATRLFNLTVTNVPGAQAPRYAFGAAPAKHLTHT